MNWQAGFIPESSILTAKHPVYLELARRGVGYFLHSVIASLQHSPAVVVVAGKA